MEQFIDKAKILIEALPYINRFKGNTIVIKYGGSAIGDKKIKDTIIQDIALMKIIGFNPVVVHGGGKEINTMLERLNIESNFLEGLRVTTKETMEVVEMVLTGKLNKEIVADLTKQGVKVAGISGKDGNMLTATKLLQNGQDIGFVGEVKKVNTDLIESLIKNDFIPVISPVGMDDEGNSYNINADYAASAIASALKASKLVFLTDVKGIMMNVDDSTSIIPEIRIDEVKKLLDDGTISGGMIPKVACCLEAIENGVNNVHILDGRIEHSLLLEIFTNKGIGTLIKKFM